MNESVKKKGSVLHKIPTVKRKEMSIHTYLCPYRKYRNRQKRVYISTIGT